MTSPLRPEPPQRGKLAVVCDPDARQRRRLARLRVPSQRNQRAPPSDTRSQRAGGPGKHQRQPESVPEPPRAALARWAAAPGLATETTGNGGYRRGNPVGWAAEGALAALLAPSLDVVPLVQ